MLAPLSMTDTEYQLWRNDTPYVEWLVDEMGYDEFSETCLMPSLISKVCVLSFFTSLPLFAHGNTQM